MDIKKIIDFLRDEKKRIILDMLRDNYPYSINEITKLEEQYSDFPIKDLLSLIKIQQRFKHKIDNSEKMIFTDKGGQQASSTMLAKYHAEKFVKFSRIADLCCGIGIDLIHLAEDKDSVFAVDSDPDTLEVAKYNCSIVNRKNVTFQNQNAEDFDRKVDAIFSDPDRRPSNKRKIDPNELSPKLTDILSLRNLTENIAVKLSPAMDYNKMELPFEHTFEFISENGKLKEILLCSGKLHTIGITRKAVLLPQKTEILNSDKRVAVRPINNFIFEPDNAVIRAGLVQECGWEIGYDLIDEKLALLTGSKQINSNLGKCFKVITVFGYDVKKLKRFCKEFDVGDLVIKTRGFPLTVEKLRRKINLKLNGRNKKILFIIRRKDDHQMMISEENS
ncbi:MAG: class I SAM-dependent methyltransferase [Candidatus Cloacimonetes bacterium]|nr:class I SAM-dependent methyltransferase [Candidatus Cloacimonadota bacterium]MCF7813367.1 class I SAM-dependent methyltransferase [Candidatus Cloacimonadota bacterium]MCF7867508.1 class I SAM-dependent methyltransferase [Candidatus Cloacimonadota bacterium]MCF7882990.1 class I SAM-dependent methyltransferase [Candidatus Cloacimonadota bacterium]